MHGKHSQQQLAMMLIAIAQAIIEGRLLFTDFASASNIKGDSHIEFDLIDCDMPVAYRPTAAGSETMQ